jgi:hypothetical protein
MAYSHLYVEAKKIDLLAGERMVVIRDWGGCKGGKDGGGSFTGTGE